MKQRIALIFLCLYAPTIKSMEFDAAFEQLRQLIPALEYHIQAGEHLKKNNNLDNLSADFFATKAAYMHVTNNILASCDDPESQQALIAWGSQADWHTRMLIHDTLERMHRINDAIVQTESHKNNLARACTWLQNITPYHRNIVDALISPFLITKNLVHLGCLTAIVAGYYLLRSRKQTENNNNHTYTKESR